MGTELVHSPITTTPPEFSEKSYLWWFSLLFLPILLFSGWLVYVIWTLGLAGWWSAVIGLFVILLFLFYLPRNKFTLRSEIRWFIAPAVILILFWYVPWWDYHHQRFDTGGYLLAALEMLNHPHFVEYSDFRSPAVPGLLSIELFLTNSHYTTFYIPILLYIATSWQVQHLAERWGNSNLAILCAISFILLPTIRFFGQLAMTDVALCGIWLFTLQLLIYSEKYPKNHFLAYLLGATISLTFFTKQTYIYLVGIIGWMCLKDRNLKRMRECFIGWLLITVPFMLHNWVEKGHPFFPLVGQTTFAFKSVTGTYDTYTTSTFLNELTEELSILVLFFSCLGALKLAKDNSTESISLAVMLTPLIILNGIILDWGEPRYNTPLFAAILLMLVVRNRDSSPLNTDKLFSIISVFLLLSVIFVNISQLPEESKESHLYNDNMREWTNFEVQVLQELTHSNSLLAGRASSIELMTEINTIRYEHRDTGCECDEGDMIQNTLSLYQVEYAITTNVAPYFQWEKDFDWQLGHGSIEIEKIHYETWWSAVLWKIDDTSYLPPSEFYKSHNGTVIGDLLILGPNESLTVGSIGVSLNWIEVSSIRPHQQVMRVLTGEESLMISGCIDGSEESKFSPGDTLTSSSNNYIYSWITNQI